MEFLWSDRKFGGIAPDLVEGDEAGGSVERGVLGTHGHDHAAGLLDTAGDLSRGVLTYAQVDGLQLGGDVRATVAGPVHGPGPGVTSLGQVGTVHVEGAEEFDDGLRTAGCGGTGVGRGGQKVDDATYLGTQKGARGVSAGLGVGVFDVDGYALFHGQGGQCAFPGGVDEHTTQFAQGVVTGGPGHGPGGAQALARGVDLFHDDPPGEASGEPTQVASRVTESVDVVHTQAVQLPRCRPAQGFGVGGFEDRRVHHSDGGKGVDVEEASIGQFAVPTPPGNQPVVLAFVHLRGGVPGFVRAGGQWVMLVVMDQAAIVDGELFQRGPSVVPVIGQNGDQDRSCVEIDVEAPRVD